ncbi:MAG: helix-turn-helix domain-containing protein [Eubacterium sp.]
MTIKEARTSIGLTQQGVTDWIGIPRRTLQDWEAGKRKCPDWCEKLVVEKLLTYKKDD